MGGFHSRYLLHPELYYFRYNNCKIKKFYRLEDDLLIPFDMWSVKINHISAIFMNAIKERDPNLDIAYEILEIENEIKCNKIKIEELTKDLKIKI